jgi:hypothetical protein
MGLLINVDAVWGYMGQILVFDSFMEGAGEFSLPPKWWDWFKSPDGWMIGKWQWVRCTMPEISGITSTWVWGDPQKSPPHPEPFKNLVDKDGPVVVQGGSDLCMALYRRSRGFDADWQLYVLLALSMGGVRSGLPLPDINKPLRIALSPMSEGSGWGYFGKKGDPNRNPRSPEGIWQILWSAKWFDANHVPERKGLDDPYEDWRFDAPPGKKKPEPRKPTPFLGRPRRGVF